MPKGVGYKHGKASFMNKKGKEKVIKPLKKKKEKKNSDLNKGRIFEGPRGGQWTPRKARKEDY